MHMNIMAERKKSLKMDDYGFGYRGTFPLDFETFPEVPRDDGKEGFSNIITQLEGSDEKGWYLFPTMVGGKRLKEEYRGGNILEFLDKNLDGKHFGMFKSYDEGMEADSLIHEHFRKSKIEKSIIDSITK